MLGLFPRRHVDLACAGRRRRALAYVVCRLFLDRFGRHGSVRVEGGFWVVATRAEAGEIAIRDTGSRHMAEQVRAGELDLAFVGLFPDQVPGDLAHRILTDESLVVVVPRGHALAGAPADLAALAAESAFVEMRPESGLRAQVDAAFARAGLTRRIAFELSTSAAVVRFVTLGFGAAVVPRSAAAAWPGDVAVLDLADPAARHPISLVHRSPEPSTPSARAFLALLAASETRQSTPQPSAADR